MKTSIYFLPYVLRINKRHITMHGPKNVKFFIISRSFLLRMRNVTDKSCRAVFVNNQLDAQFFFMYVYFYYLHVSGSHVPIIRRINCINTTSGICHSV